jgi:hypothetical protein
MGTQRQFNERPSKYRNIGHDIQEAHRHKFSTYETDEEKTKRETADKLTKDRKQLKQEYAIKLSSVNTLEDAINIIKEYETEYCLLTCRTIGVKCVSLEELRNIVLSTLNDYKKIEDPEERKKVFDKSEFLRRAYNRAISKRRNIRRIQSLEYAQKYFGKRQVIQFTEYNGKSSPWILEGSFDSSCVEYLKNTVGAIQFGNSVTDKEREFCLHNLSETIKKLKSYFTKFDFKSLGYAFASRGKKGSIAHYSSKHKVLAFNHGWIGSFIHELGHAIDDSLNRASKNIPLSLIDKYRKKLENLRLPSIAFRYYLKENEIFARLFEVYIRDQNIGLSPWALTVQTEDLMPDLCNEAKEFMDKTLNAIK